ncbi:hypothetical protein HZA57_06105 [Candidatus Poribacteria bacterium]|nr:hypothetical protein [Candidatus Poribacteria bacterium]
MNPDPTPAAETIRHSVGSVSPLTPLADWDDANTQDPDFRDPNANVMSDILPYAVESGSSEDWPNVFSPMNIQGFFQDGMWASEDDRGEHFAERYEWMRGASYNAVSNINSKHGGGKTRKDEKKLDPTKAIVTAGTVAQAIARQGAPSAADGLVVTGSLDAAAAALVPVDWNNTAAFRESGDETEEASAENETGDVWRVNVSEINGAEHNVYANRRFTREFQNSTNPPHEDGTLAEPVDARYFYNEESTQPSVRSRYTAVSGFAAWGGVRRPEESNCERRLAPAFTY